MLVWCKYQTFVSSHCPLYVLSVLCLEKSKWGIKNAFLIFSVLHTKKPTVLSGFWRNVVLLQDIVLAATDSKNCGKLDFFLLIFNVIFLFWFCAPAIPWIMKLCFLTLMGTCQKTHKLWNSHQDLKYQTKPIPTVKNRCKQNREKV